MLQPPYLDKRVVTYHNGAGQHAWAVSRAVRAWNLSGADMTLRPGPREEAELVFSYMQHGATLGGRTIQLDRSKLPDDLGRTRPGDAVVQVPLLSEDDARERRFDIALVVAHELGHVFGLGHEDATCAAMNSSIVEGAPSGCSPPPPAMWRCRLVEEDDARGVIALYGGELGAISEREFCPRAPRPSPPVTLSAQLRETRAGEVVVRGRVGRSPGGSKVVLSRGRAGCPLSPADSVASTAPARGGRFRILLSHRLTASTCYAAWSKDRFGRLSSRPATAWFNPPPPPPPPDDVVLSSAPGVTPGGFGAGLRWRNPVGERVAAVLLAWDPEGCRAHPGEDGSVRRIRPTTGAQRYLDLRLFAVPPGSGCYTLWSSDVYGRVSRPVHVSVGRQRPDAETWPSVSSAPLPFGEGSG